MDSRIKSKLKRVRQHNANCKKRIGGWTLRSYGRRDDECYGSANRFSKDPQVISQINQDNKKERAKRRFCINTLPVMAKRKMNAFMSAKEKARKSGCK